MSGELGTEGSLRGLRDMDTASSSVSTLASIDTEDLRRFTGGELDLGEFSTGEDCKQFFMNVAAVFSFNCCA
jgi:hypothetical protein